MKLFSTLIGAATVVLLAAALGLTMKDGDHERPVSLDELPVAVRATILKYAAGAEIREIEADTEDGELVYDVEIVRDGRVQEFMVSPEGVYLGMEEEGYGGRDDDDDDDDDDEDEDGDDEGHWVPVDFGDVPAAAREVVLEYTTIDAITTVERSDAEDVPVFEVEYLIDGSEQDIMLTADGEIMRLESTIAAADLPPAVLAELREECPGATITEAEAVQLFYYVIELSIDGEEHEVAALASGELEDDDEDGEDDADDDDDDEDDD